MPATTTYLTIVNNSIQEAGLELASFLANGSDFTTNTNAMMQRFRVWVSRAWKTIQQECYDWEFMQEEGVVNIDPGIMFYTDGTPFSTFATAFANTSNQSIFDQSGAVAIPNVPFGTAKDLTATSTLTLPFGYLNLIGTGSIPVNFALKPGAEYITTGGHKAYVHSWKSFDINEEIGAGDFQEVIQEIDSNSFRIIDFYNSTPSGELPLPFMAWESFRSSYDQSAAFTGTPRLISEDNTGRWRLYPVPQYTYTLKFDYIRQPQILSAFGDIPRGLNDDFVDIIMWKALIYYGEFDEQPSVVLRARGHYKNLLSRLEQKNRAKFHFKPKRLW